MLHNIEIIICKSKHLDKYKITIVKRSHMQSAISLSTIHRSKDIIDKIIN
jgi:hypothetical protein